MHIEREMYTTCLDLRRYMMYLCREKYIQNEGCVQVCIIASSSRASVTSSPSLRVPRASILREPTAPRRRDRPSADR